MQVHTLPGGLDGLLGETIAAATSREAQAFTREAGPYGTPLVLFGAGSLGRKVLACLRRDGIEPLAFADNDPLKWGMRVDGLQVVDPGEACGLHGSQAAFVVTIWSPGHSFRQTREQLRRLGCQKVIPVLPLLWRYPDALLPHYCFDLPHRLLEHASEIRRADGLWCDQESRHQYAAHLRFRLLADFGALPAPSPDDQYFARDIVSLMDTEVFIDAGAYLGSTIQAFLQRRGSRFKRIWAFEPDPLNASRLRGYVSGLEPAYRDRIRVLEMAVGGRRERTRFAASGTAGAAFDPGGELEVECAPLDGILATEEPTFLKFDIEGAEHDALLGALRLIRRARPLIAVCVYHQPDHLWRIPLCLDSLGAGYRFSLRSHGEDGLDTVLYAVPEARLRVGEAGGLRTSAARGLER